MRNMEMIKFAIKNQEGKWRSASWSDSFGEWDDAQLWNNAKTAKTEIKRQENRHRFDHANRVEGQPVPRIHMNLKCELVVVNIAEPQ